MTKCTLKVGKAIPTAEVEKAIDLAIQSAGSARNNIQMAAMQIVRHIQRHGDYTLANKLVDGMPSGIKADSLVAYFREFACLKSGAESFTGFRDGLKHEEAAGLIKKTWGKAQSTWWYSFGKKTNPHVDFDINKRLDALFKTLEKEAKKARETGNANIRTEPDDDHKKQVLEFLNIKFVNEAMPAGTPAH